MVTWRNMAGGLALVLAGVFLRPAGADAQLDKIFRRGNVEAVKKATQAAVLTDDQIQELSLQSVRYMDANNPVAKTGDPYADRLARLVAGLKHEDGLELNFSVYLVRDVNAFATPDGSVRVMAGLMELMTDEELRAVIGHEIGHVKLKHSRKQYQKAYAVSAGRDAAIANTGSASVIAESELGDFVEEVLNAKFSRDDESSADKYGFRFMLKHDYDYHGMQTAFLKLGALAGDKVNRSLKATHPAPDDRAKEAKKWAEAEDRKRAAEQVTEVAATDVPAQPATEPRSAEVSEPATAASPKAPPSPPRGETVPLSTLAAAVPKSVDSFAIVRSNSRPIPNFGMFVLDSLPMPGRSINFIAGADNLFLFAATPNPGTIQPTVIVWEQPDHTKSFVVGLQTGRAGLLRLAKPVGAFHVIEGRWDTILTDSPVTYQIPSEHVRDVLPELGRSDPDRYGSLEQAWTESTQVLVQGLANGTPCERYSVGVTADRERCAAQIEIYCGSTAEAHRTADEFERAKKSAEGVLGEILKRAVVSISGNDVQVSVSATEPEIAAAVEEYQASPNPKVKRY